MYSIHKMQFYAWISRWSGNESQSQDYQSCAGKAKILKKHEVKHIQGHTSPSKLLSDTWQGRQKLERSYRCISNFVWGTRRTCEHTHRGLRDTATWVTWVCARFGEAKLTRQPVPGAACSVCSASRAQFHRGQLAGARAPPARPGALPGPLAEARRCGARHRERARCPGGGGRRVPGEGGGRPSAARCGQDACAVRGGGRRIPALGAAGTGAGMSGGFAAPSRTWAERQRGKPAAMGEQLRAQPAAPGGPPPAAASCSLLGGLLQNGFHPSGPPLSNGSCGEPPHPLLLRPELPPLSHGSPAKKCRLRRRLDSGRRHRPRKWWPRRLWGLAPARPPPLRAALPQPGPVSADAGPAPPPSLRSAARPGLTAARLRAAGVPPLNAGCRAGGARAPCRPMRRRSPGTAPLPHGPGPPCANGAAAGGERRPGTNAGGRPLLAEQSVGRCPGSCPSRRLPAAYMKLIVPRQHCE